MKKSTMYWTLSKLVEASYLNRVRNGIYSFNEFKGKSAKFLHHVPEDYPIMIFVEKLAYEEVASLLRASKYSVTEQTKLILNPFT